MPDFKHFINVVGGFMLLPSILNRDQKADFKMHRAEHKSSNEYFLYVCMSQTDDADLNRIPGTI